MATSKKTENPGVAPQELATKLITDAIQKLLSNLRLNGPEYSGLITAHELEQMVQLELAKEQSGQAKPTEIALSLVNQRLYQHCKSQNEQLHNTAYDWLSKYLYRYLWFKLNQDEQTAYDLTNDCLATILVELRDNKLRSSASFLHWTRQIAHRAYQSYYRDKAISPPDYVSLYNNTASAANEVKNWQGKANGEIANPHLNPSLDSQNPFEDKLADNTYDPEKLVLSRETQQLFLERVRQLKTTTKRGSKYQFIIIATYLLDWSDAMIARHLGVKLTDVYNMRYEAHKLVRRHWQTFSGLGDD